MCCRYPGLVFEVQKAGETNLLCNGNLFWTVQAKDNTKLSEKPSSLAFPVEDATLLWHLAFADLSPSFLWELYTYEG